MLRPLFLVPLLLLAVPVYSQELPKKIRGYTVHRDTVTVKSDGVNSPAPLTDVVLKVDDPVLTDLGLDGVTFEVSARIRSARQTGKVDFLSFHDFRINGLSVNVEEYRHSFSFRRNETINLPAPAKVFLPTTQLLSGAWREMRESKKQWTVTGRVFVFGRFRRFGFNHRRVIPIDISLDDQESVVGPSRLVVPQNSSVSLSSFAFFAILASSA